ncbi:MAG: type IV toxin-antitoxin system AbiEi family antitoxin [Armatimonadetes bacterium]|nr:type IV toxin-antitoxin system AbiEi family antitoxin [Armatimonadota bacterium]
MKSEQVSCVEAEDVLRSRLEEVPFIQIRQLGLAAPADCGLDIRADVLVGNRPIAVFAEIKSDGTPRAVRETAARISGYLERIPLKSYGVLIAPYISEDAGAILDEQGVGYIDLAGNCRLCFEQVYVRVHTGGKPKLAKQALRSVYTPKAARVLRLLLGEPGKAWKVQEIAERAEISLGQAWKVKDQLCAREWLKEQGRGLVLTKPEALLKDWAGNYKPARKETVYDFYSFQKPSEVEYRLADECGARNIPYALAEFSGGARYAPVVRYTRASAYVGGGIDELAEALELKRVPSGANVRLILAKDSGVFLDAREKDGVKIVSPVQAYLDLLSVPSRGEEAADGILKKEIEQKWR